MSIPSTEPSSSPQTEALSAERDFLRTLLEENQRKQKSWWDIPTALISIIVFCLAVFGLLQVYNLFARESQLRSLEGELERRRSETETELKTLNTKIDAAGDLVKGLDTRLDGAIAEFRRNLGSEQLRSTAEIRQALQKHVDDASRTDAILGIVSVAREHLHSRQDPLRARSTIKVARELYDEFRDETLQRPDQPPPVPAQTTDEFSADAAPANESLGATRTLAIVESSIWRVECECDLQLQDYATLKARTTQLIDHGPLKTLCELDPAKCLKDELHYYRAMGGIGLLSTNEMLDRCRLAPNYEQNCAERMRQIDEILLDLDAAVPPDSDAGFMQVYLIACLLLKGEVTHGETKERIELAFSRLSLELSTRPQDDVRSSYVQSLMSIWEYLRGDADAFVPMQCSKTAERVDPHIAHLGRALMLAFAMERRRHGEIRANNIKASGSLPPDPVDVESDYYGRFAVDVAVAMQRLCKTETEARSGCSSCAGGVAYDVAAAAFPVKSANETELIEQRSVPNGPTIAESIVAPAYPLYAYLGLSPAPEFPVVSTSTRLGRVIDDKRWMKVRRLARNSQIEDERGVDISFYWIPKNLTSAPPLPFEQLNDDDEFWIREHMLPRGGASQGTDVLPPDVPETPTPADEVPAPPAEAPAPAPEPMPPAPPLDPDAL